MNEDFTVMHNPQFLYRAGLHHPFPDWVANEPIPSAEDFVEKSAAAFADPGRRLLPICTPNAAFHSMLNVMAHPEQFDERTFDRVKSACSQFQIEADIAPYAQLFVSEFEKKAAAADEQPQLRFAIDTVIGDQEYRLLPLQDREDVVTSSFELAKMASENRVPLPIFVSAAREVVKAAAEFGVDKLPDTVAWYGADRHPDAERAARLLKGRADLCKDATVRETIARDYQEALADLEKDPDVAMEKIAAIDFVVGIPSSCRLASPIPNPFEIVFGGPLDSEVEKAAAANSLIRDILVPVEALRAIPVEEVEFKLSKSASDEFFNIREEGDGRDFTFVVGNWGEEDQRTLLRLAAQAG